MSSEKVARLFIKHSIMLIQGIDANASKHSSPEHRVHGSRVKRQRTVLILTCEETTPQRGWTGRVPVRLIQVVHNE